MRLTNTIRDAFILAAMQDVPREDYREQAEKLVREELAKLFKQTFPGIDYEAACASGWLERKSVNTPRGLPHSYLFAPNYKCLEGCPAWEKLTALGEKALQQEQRIGTLESKLRAVAYSVTTRKALVAALPEFEKYLPAEEAAAMRMLPAVANVVAEFTKAGWPKNKRVAA